MSKSLTKMPSGPLGRAWWADKAREILWVALVAVLIWVYADMEFTRERSFTVVVDLASSDPDLALLSASQLEVSLALQGNIASLENFERLSGSIRYDVSQYGPSQAPIAIPTREILLQTAEIGKAGLTLVSCTPSSISIRLDEVLAKELPVEFRHTGATVAGAVVTPSKVRVRVAQSQWQEILRRTATPTLRTETVNLQKVDTAKPFPVEIEPVVAGVPVGPQRETVEVQVQVAELTKTRTLSVPVRVMAPASWSTDGTWDQYVLERKNASDWTHKEIVVEGPTKDIDRLVPEAVDAYVVLTDNDKKPTESWWKGDVVVRFPAEMNVKLVSKPTLDYRLAKRANTTP